MPIVYENAGHARRMQKMYPQFQWKMTQWRKNKTCWICEQEMHIEHSEEKPWALQASVDHMVAQCLGGPDEEDNWQLICAGCNNKKSKVENKLLTMIKRRKKRP
jgi:5-methylcytosine-specific restriction endonuclease McrA